MCICTKSQKRKKDTKSMVVNKLDHLKVLKTRSF